MNRPTATLTTSCGDVPVTVSAVDFHLADERPQIRPDASLNASIVVREDGTISIIPLDTVAALLLEAVSAGRMTHMRQGNGPGNPMPLLSLDLHRPTAPTLSRDGSAFTTRQLSDSDYRDVCAFLGRRAAAKVVVKRTKAKTRRRK